MSRSVPLPAMLVPMALAIVLLVAGTAVYSLTYQVGAAAGAKELSAYLPMVAMGYGTIVILALAVVELRFYKFRADDLERRESRLRKAVAELEMDEESRSDTLAGMLHDDIGGGLSALKMELDMIEKGGHESLERCHRSVDRLLGLVRGLSRTIYPKAVGSLGLPAMLGGISETLGDSWRQRIEIETEGDLGSLSPRISLCVLRSVQEALVNAARHSNGAVVRVRVARQGNAVSGSVSDDGTGQTECREGLGLTLMRERVRSLGGVLDVRLTPAGGVEVSFRIPVGKEEAA